MFILIMANEDSAPESDTYKLFVNYSLHNQDLKRFFGKKTVAFIRLSYIKVELQDLGNIRLFLVFLYTQDLDQFSFNWLLFLRNTNT